ncbi:MAG: hypothetical protein ACE5EX_04995 [Phycisphaerae bacterium]
MTPINLLDSNDLVFVVALCNSFSAVPTVFGGVSVEVRAPTSQVRLVSLPNPNASDVSSSLPVSQVGFPVGSTFVVEMWAQTDSENGLAQVSADIAFDFARVSAGTIAHSALFNLFTAGSVDNFSGTIDNVSGAHPPAVPACSDTVGTSPNWARVATINMTADAVGPLTIQSADANDLIFVMAVCGSEVAPNTVFGGAAIAVTQCGNGITEPGEQCDDANMVAGDCCSPTCQFETPSTVCRSAIDACDAPEFCDGAGGCPVDGFQPAGTSCGDPAATVCDDPDTCDGAGLCRTNLVPSTTECRAAASACDVAEFCDGAGGCPADTFQPAGATCGDPTSTVCDNADTCDGAGSCQTNFEPGTTECRAAVGTCDASEFCDGLGSCPVDGFQPPGTPCGDPANTVCDNPDSCDGAGSCQANVEPPTSVCRAAAGDCDTPEFCDGLGRCPNDGFVPVGTACGDPTNTTCDNPDTCDGLGSCLANPELSTTLCRGAAGPCDVTEFCDGAGSCPVDTFQPAGTTCGDPASGICDNADTCDGAGACQSNFEPGTTECRAAVSICDAPEFCDGAGGCPVDAFEPPTVVCRPAAGACDVADFCDGAGQCAADSKAVDQCRPKATECDVAEFCDGVGNDCPVDLFQPVGTACGDPTSTACDDADTCDGLGTCLPNPEPVTTVCRASTGECDAADFCDGAGVCSVDLFQPAGTACGDPTSGVCDNADTCDGFGACQSNPQPSSILCRPPAGECDAAEFCDGAGGCAVDGFRPAGTACGNPVGSVCDNPDTCDGAGACQSNFAGVSTLCRTSADECDADEFCDGAGNCPADLFQIAGTACGDATVTVCDNADSCDGLGTCQSNPKPVTTPCRAPAGVCDLPDFCDGAGQCSADAKATSECRAAVDECDVAESCDGVGDDCPADAFQVAGSACGDPSVRPCDNADTCDGAGACSPNPATDGTPCSDASFCNGAEVCLGGLCSGGPAVCTDACEHCDESVGACGWCIFDHNLNRTMDGFDFSFFSGCFGVCVPPEDPCFAANYDADPNGCVGGGDFGAFSGCFSLTCETCANCSGPTPNDDVITATSLQPFGATVQLVATDSPPFDDVSNMPPVSRRSVGRDESFEVEVWASISRGGPEGLGSVYVDVLYDPGLLAVEEVMPSTSFTTLSRGFIDADAGHIAALGGCAALGEGRLGSASTWVRVATVRVRARGSGLTTVTAVPSHRPYGVSVFGRFGDLYAGQVEFGEIAFRIARRSEPTTKHKVRERSSR